MHLRTTCLATTAALAALATATPALAKHGDVRVSGSCTGSSSSKLKAGARDGGLEVEWEVDQNRNGKRWRWTLRADGAKFASGKATTKAPSGSFSVERRSGGAGRITATARNLSSGERCTAKIELPA